MNTSRNAVTGLCSVFGLAAILIGSVGQSAARADDGWRYDHRDRIETDRRILREDESHLHRLERRLDDQTANHDWRGARDTRREMDRTRADIDRDQRNLDRDYGHRGDYHNHE